MKKALLIGINYINTGAELNGCINDIYEVQNILTEKYKYNDFTILTDNTELKPTKTNILNSLKKIISDSFLCKEIWIHYSGHGTSVADINKDELDRKDEALVPLDYEINGFIIDDELNQIISNVKCNTRVILDCCHSGTALDLYYNTKISSNKIVKRLEKKYKLPNLNSNIFMISGCMDNQTSADAYNIAKNKAMGALTSGFLNVLQKNNFSIKVSDLLKQLHSSMISGGYTQNPTFSSNKPINLNSFYISMDNNKNKDIFDDISIAKKPAAKKSAAKKLAAKKLAAKKLAAKKLAAKKLAAKKLAAKKLAAKKLAAKKLAAKKLAAKKLAAKKLAAKKLAAKKLAAKKSVAKKLAAKKSAKKLKK